MLQLLLLLAFAYYQDSYGKNSPAYLWALAFAAVNALLTLITEQGVLTAILSFVILGLYAWGLFVVLRRFGDNLILWLVICVLGALLPILLL